MSLSVTVAGEPVLLRPSGTLWVEQYSTLVVADLHLEKGSAYAMRGQLLPPYDTRETLQRLLDEVAKTQPKRLVFLGDSLHDMGAISRIPLGEREALIVLAQQLELVWISGNHDPDGGSAFGGKTLETLRLGSLELCHEPKAGHQFGEVAGHLHPCAKLSGAGGSLRRRCFISDGKRLILPAFGAYTGGLNVLDEAYAGMFEGQTCAYLTGGKVSPVGLDKLSHDRRLKSRTTRISVR